MKLSFLKIAFCIIPTFVNPHHLLNTRSYVVNGEIDAQIRTAKYTYYYQ